IVYGCCPSPGLPATRPPAPLCKTSSPPRMGPRRTSRRCCREWWRLVHTHRPTAAIVLMTAAPAEMPAIAALPSPLPPPPPPPGEDPAVVVEVAAVPPSIATSRYCVVAAPAPVVVGVARS